MDSTLRVCGAVGEVERERVSAMAARLGDLPVRADGPNHLVIGTGRCVHRTDPAGAAVAWRSAPLGELAPATWRQVAAAADVCGVVASPARAELHGSISGASPLFAEVDATGATFATHLDALAATAAALRPDWDAWSEILALGGPLEGRTTFLGLRRLGPWSSVVADDAGARVEQHAWPWVDVDGARGSRRGVGAVREALVHTVRDLADAVPERRLQPLLSGGWDSRILATIARSTLGDRAQLTGWTTSPDTGTTLDQLVAARVAERLGIEHVIVVPRHDRFARDVADYAEAVDHLTSFHVWLLPLAERLGTVDGLALDGLGGGIFLGGAFPDEAGRRPTVGRRFARMAHYLRDGERVLRGEALAQIAARARAGFASVATSLLDHPQGATFTAYLTRTLPGISLGPMALLSGRIPTATPFLADDVVRAALAMPVRARAGGRAYPGLLRGIDRGVASLATASALTGRRQHVRRGASHAAAAWYRTRLTGGPVAELLAPELRRAPTEAWVELLRHTRSQHLIRSLTMLDLWLERYAPTLTDVDLGALRAPTG